MTLVLFQCPRAVTLASPDSDTGANGTVEPCPINNCADVPFGSEPVHVQFFEVVLSEHRMTPPAKFMLMPVVPFTVSPAPAAIVKVFVLVTTRAPSEKKNGSVTDTEADTGNVHVVGAPQLPPEQLLALLLHVLALYSDAPMVVAAEPCCVDAALKPAALASTNASVARSVVLSPAACVVALMPLASAPATTLAAGRPVALVSVPPDGVPRAPPLTTKAPALPTLTAQVP